MMSSFKWLAFYYWVCTQVSLCMITMIGKKHCQFSCKEDCTRALPIYPLSTLGVRTGEIYTYVYTMIWTASVPLILIIYIMYIDRWIELVQAQVEDPTLLTEVKLFDMYMWLGLQEYGISAHIIWTVTYCIPYTAKVTLVEINFNTKFIATSIIKSTKL